MKRKHDELDDSDSEEPSFGRQILPVADLPNDFNGEPLDGMQYLFTVRRDAKALPHVTRAPNPYEHLTKGISSNTFREQPHPAIPSTEWRELTEMRWANLRKNFNQLTIGPFPPTSGRKLMPDKKERDLWWHFLSGKPEHVWNPPVRNSKKKSKSKQKQRDCSTEGDMHSRDDQAQEQIERGGEHGEYNRDEVRVRTSILCSEIPKTTVVTGQIESQPKIESQDFLPTPTGTPVPLDGADRIGEVGSASSTIGENVEEGDLAPREPSPQLLKLIDERMALHLLMYFAHWINLYLRDGPDSPTYRPMNVHARWIFSLLLRIDDYIGADDISLLRNLARACLTYLKVTILNRTRGDSSTFLPLSQEKDSDGKPMDERAYWIIICAIAGIWGQRDLWADAEDILSSP